MQYITDFKKMLSFIFQRLGKICFINYFAYYSSLYRGKQEFLTPEHNKSLWQLGA